MATVHAFIRVSTKKIPKGRICFRLKDGRSIDLHYKSEFEVIPDLWDAEAQQHKTRKLINPEERAVFNDAITSRKALILKIYNAQQTKEGLTSDWLDGEIDKALHPEKYKPVEVVKESFFDTFDEFLLRHKISEVRKSNYRVVYRALKRFELYKNTISKKPFILSLDNLSSSILQEFDKFLRIEYTFYESLPEIYKDVPEVRKPEARGSNTVNGIFAKIRTFVLWSIKEEKTTNNAFLKFKIDESVYGTPYFITIEERNQLYNFDLSANPVLAEQRDIFVFQCLIGCRMGDLYSFTKSNIVNGAVEYIARKSKEDRPVKVRVMLNKCALEILSRYSSLEGERLLPLATQQDYNEAIKAAFKLADLCRIVTIQNPTTRETEQKPLNEIASSHLARRTFIGNLYKKVQDPNLIGSMSGHVEGSKAFARYREIDDTIKTELVNLLD